MLLGTLGATLLRNQLTGKDISGLWNLYKKTKKESKNSKKQNIQEIFIKTKYINLVFNMT